MVPQSTVLALDVFTDRVGLSGSGWIYTPPTLHPVLFPEPEEVGAGAGNRLGPQEGEGRVVPLRSVPGV